MTEKLLCMDCGRTSFEEDSSGSSVLSKFIGAFFFILRLALLGLPFFRRKKSNKKSKKNCDYCGSNFLFPDSAENRELLKSFKPTTKK